MSSPSAALIASELSQHPEVDALATHVHRVLLGAAAARDLGRLAAPPDEDHPLEAEQAETEQGNVLEILERGPTEPREAALLAALLVRGIALEPPTSAEGWRELAVNLAWLAARTPVSAFDALDSVLRDRAGELWRALGIVAEAPEKAACGRAEALVAAAALASSQSAEARTAAAQVGRLSADPLVKAACRGSEPAPETLLSGELRSVPKGPVATAVLGLTGILLLWRGAAVVGRYALGFRRPAEVRLTRRGLELESRAYLLGRVLHERHVMVPLGELARASREVKYARLGLYAGLVALVLGSYFGMGLFIDGLRVPGGSPPLLGLGVLLVVAGLALDYGLSRLADAARGQCRLVVVPRKGKAFCIGGLEPERTDRVLQEIARHGSAPAAAEPSG
jgi:hypothetical protein